MKRLHLLKPLRSAMLMPGSRTRMTMKPGSGRTLEMPPRRGWKHPWQITPMWDGASQAWEATMQPGWVNGECPVYVTTVNQSPSNWKNYGINPLSGEPFFSAWVFNQEAATVPAATTVWLPLYANPLIDLSWRNIGWDDATASNSVPQFFLNLGVVQPNAINDDNITDATASTLLTPAPAGTRLLRACDLVLHQPHVALTSQITLEPGLLTGQSNVTQTLGLTTINPNDPLKIAAGIDPLSGDYTAPAYDEILIGTAYLLSPPDAKPYSAPDAAWTPYVRHALFWNLLWAQPQLTVENTTDNALGQLASLVNIMAAGSGGVAVNFITASLNDAASAALNILEANSMAGSFWTPTGGGWTSLFPPAPSAAVTAPSGHGLDKNGLIEAQSRAAAMALASQQLDPDFPYAGVKFNTGMLS